MKTPACRARAATSSTTPATRRMAAATTTAPAASCSPPKIRQAPRATLCRLAVYRRRRGSLIAKPRLDCGTQIRCTAGVEHGRGLLHNHHCHCCAAHERANNKLAGASQQRWLLQGAVRRGKVCSASMAGGNLARHAPTRMSPRGCRAGPKYAVRVQGLGSRITDRLWLKGILSFKVLTSALGGREKRSVREQGDEHMMQV